MQKNGLMNLIDVFLSKEDVKRQKPDPMMINRALGMVGGEPERALMVGDTGMDMVGAKSAGIDSALYYPKRYEEYYAKRLQEGWKSTYVVRGFGELARFLK
jgi:phosphoglycolate phosphatase-like HAD superfamily hydrolase